MNFFRKRTPEKTAMQAEEPKTASIAEETTTAPVAESTAHANEGTPEEEARRWFEARFQTDMPEELTRMFRRMAQAEAKRQKVGEDILTANELRNIQEQIRLCRTKLTNINQTLSGLQAQKEWLHKFKTLENTLDKHKQAAFESNKQYSARLRDIRELERHETFECVQGDYRQIKVKEAILQELRVETSEQLRKLESIRQECTQTAKQEEAETKSFQEKKSEVLQMQDIVAEGLRMQATRQIHEEELKELAEYKALTAQKADELRERADELADELKKARERHTYLLQQQQSLTSQQKMLEKGEMLQVKLDFLQTFESRKKDLQYDLERTLKKQHEQDEKLNKLFSMSQDIDAEIKTLQSELQVHRKSILGMNSYNLQQRAMDLKSNKEQLVNASSLWKQIAEGYALVDEKGQEIVRMRHHNEALKSRINALETEVNGLQTHCNELEYAYTLSKSQDVMQLRKDLREGTNCSVCGATHHPYHSDTLLEQSKLIGKLKTDLEHISTELKHKKASLDELRREQATEDGRIETAYQALDIYKQILQTNVSQWANFASLDRSFKECSPSTNFDGRRIMLQQLMEKTSVDAEDAQKELDTFNYHQSNINAINERLSRKEQEKNNLVVRLNEVNTGSQVIAYRVEQLQHYTSQNNDALSELYEEVDHIMAISNWYKVWKENPETLKIYIRQQMTQWFEVKEQINESDSECSNLQIELDMTERHLKTLMDYDSLLAEKIEKSSESKKQTESRLRKIFPEDTVENSNKNALEKLFAAEEAKEQSSRTACKIQKESAWSEGYHAAIAALTQKTEEQIASEKSALDCWIRKYNAGHSPVQFSELEHTFTNATDWNALREEIRTLALNKSVAEARMEEARLTLAAHQVNALSQGQEKEDRTAALNVEIAKLENEQSRILTKIAGYTARIEAHELGMQKQAAGHDKANE